MVNIQIMYCDSKKCAASDKFNSSLHWVGSGAVEYNFEWDYSSNARFKLANRMVSEKIIISNFSHSGNF